MGHAPIDGRAAASMQRCRGGTELPPFEACRSAVPASATSNSLNWKAGYLEIKAQRGFREEFMNFFGRVKLEDSSACARTLRKRDAVVIEDIVIDPQFSSCLEFAR